MRTRDPDAKRQLLLEGALAEFAEYGVAGARVGRLARRAGVSAGLVYSFHEGKEDLFEAVHDAVVEQAVDGVPIDADDLPEYAGRLHDATLDYPQMMRFLNWYALERGDRAATWPVLVAAMEAKVAAIADAQRRGAVDDRLDAGQLLVLIIVIATMWQREGVDARPIVTPAARRTTVVEAVRRLVAVGRPC